MHTIGWTQVDESQSDRAGLRDSTAAGVRSASRVSVCRCPCIRPGAGRAAIDWWAGPLNAESQQRHGQATRHGYIVVAPRWTRQGQRVYEYTPREHQRVLVSLRDAMRRASIDADRVFLVGHGEGATAAWDIAVSHPDIWAGMISISAEPRKTITITFPTPSTCRCTW